MPREYGGISPDPFNVSELARNLTAIIEAGDDGEIMEFQLDGHVMELVGEGPWSWYLRVED